MQVVVCSDYLSRQQYAHLSAAYQLEAHAAALQPKRGWRATLLTLLGFRSRVDMAAQQKQHALRHEAALHGQEAQYFAQGRCGEDVLASYLASRLDNRFVLLRNYTPPAPFNRGGDVDAVLVGPHGVTVFEVKTWTGRYMIQDRAWYCWQGKLKGWEPAYLNPTSQVFANMGRVKDLLRSKSLTNVAVVPIVAVGQGMQIIRMQAPGSYILHLGRSIRSLDPIFGQPHGTDLPWETCLRVYQALIGMQST